MEIEIYQKNDKILVQLSGRVVLDECDRLKGAVIPRIAPGVTSVSLDLSSVDFIDSAGLGALVGMKVTSNKSRSTLSLINPSRGVADILTVSKLDSIFDILTGPDGKQVIADLAKPEHLVSGDAGGAEETSSGQPSFQAPPKQQASPSSTDQAGMTPRQRIELLSKNAVEYMRHRDFDNAVECYRKILEIDADYLPAHNNLGVVYEKKPEWRELAVKQWERVLEISTSRNDQKHIERARKHLEDLA